MKHFRPWMLAPSALLLIWVGALLFRTQMVQLPLFQRLRPIDLREDYAKAQSLIIQDRVRSLPAVAPPVHISEDLFNEKYNSYAGSHLPCEPKEGSLWVSSVFEPASPSVAPDEWSMSIKFSNGRFHPIEWHWTKQKEKLIPEAKQVTHYVKE